MSDRSARLKFWVGCVCLFALIAFGMVQPTTRASMTLNPRVATATMTPESSRKYIEIRNMMIDSTGGSVSGLSLANLSSVRSGGGYALAVRTDGSVFGWRSAFALSMIPPGGLTIPASLATSGQNVVEVLPTYVGAFARLSDGTVTAWGCADGMPYCDVPSGLTGVSKLIANQQDPMDMLSSIAIGAIKTDGSLVLWGGSPPVPDASELTNVRDALPFSNPSSAGLTVVHTDGTVTTNARSYVVCNEGTYTTCPLVTISGLTGVQSVVAGGSNYEQVFIKTDGTLVCLCNGTLTTMHSSYGSVKELHISGSMGQRQYIGKRNDGSVFFINTAGQTLATAQPFDLYCIFHSNEYIGAFDGGVFLIGRNAPTCTTPTPIPEPPTYTATVSRTAIPSPTRPSRFSPTRAVSATSTVTATATNTATTVKTATRTATPKLGKPSATKTLIPTVTKSRTPTKAGKPTSTPTKKK